MKIKTEKHMTEKEYLHYLIDNTDFENISHDYLHVNDDVTHAEVTLELFDRYNKTDTVCYVNKDSKLMFKVTIEEDIDEDTVFKHMIEVREGLTGHMTWENATIGSEKDNSSQEFHAYIDGKYKLIWREGRLVE